MIRSTKSHSSVVTLELVFGDRRIPLVQAAHNFAIAAQPVEFPSGSAEIVMTIDGEIDRMKVFLPDGCAVDNRRFRVSS